MILRHSRVSGLMVAAALFLLVGFPRASAQTPELVPWTALGPTEEPILKLFTPASGALFAETEEQLFRSDDGGLTWSIIPRPAETSIVTVSPVNHQLLYAAGAGRVYRSDDGGVNWARVSDQMGGWKRLAVSPADPNVLFGDTATESRDTYGTTVHYDRRVSHDAGVTWEVTHAHNERRVSGSYPCAYSVTEFQPHATNIARLLTIEGCSVRGDPVSWMSYDEGRTSSPFPDVNMLDWSSNGLVGGQGISPARWYVALFRSNALYTRVRHSKVLRTDDDGNSWTVVFEEDSGEPYSQARKAVDVVSALTYDPQRPDDVFAVFEHYALNADRYKELDLAGYTVRMSRDAGVTWSELGAGGLPPVTRLAVGIDGRHLYAATRKGVYRIALSPS